MAGLKPTGRVWAFLFLGSWVGVAAGEEPSPRVTSERWVDLIDGMNDWVIAVDAQAHGSKQLFLTIRNPLDEPLRVVIPTGLVAQTRRDRSSRDRGRSDRTQDMGLRGGGEGGLAPRGSLRLVLEAVCLQHGLASPGSTHRLELMRVEDYTDDQALWRLLVLADEERPAWEEWQAAVWHVHNQIPWSEFPARIKNDDVRAPRVLARAQRLVSRLAEVKLPARQESPDFPAPRLFVSFVPDPAGSPAARRLADALVRSLNQQELLGIRSAASLGPDHPRLRRAQEPAVHAIVRLQARTESAERGQESWIVRFQTSVFGWRDGRWNALKRFDARTEARVTGPADSADQALVQAIAPVFERRLLAELVTVEPRAAVPLPDGLVRRRFFITNYLPVALDRLAAVVPFETDGGRLEPADLNLAPFASTVVEQAVSPAGSLAQGRSLEVVCARVQPPPTPAR